MQRCLAFFTFLTLTFFSTAQGNDIEILRNIHLNRNQNSDSFFKVITHSDAPISLAIPSIIFTVGILKKDTNVKFKSYMIGGSLLVSTAFTVGLKYGINRNRPFITYPEIQNIVPAKSPSFPSGHTSMAFSTATSLSIAFPKWYVIAPSFLWAGSVGYSRMHLGVHYPSDVLIGAIIGSGSAWLSCFLTKKIQLKIKAKHIIDVE